mgnify:CR=1 FL=1
MDKITFCIPSKDNLRYLKTCIPSIRKNAYRDDHEIVVFVDQDNDGTIDWLKEVHDKYNLRYLTNPNLNKSRFGIGKAYDECIKGSNTDVVMVFHADMMLGKNADKLAFDLLESNCIGTKRLNLDHGIYNELLPETCNSFIGNEENRTNIFASKINSQNIAFYSCKRFTGLTR